MKKFFMNKWCLGLVGLLLISVTAFGQQPKTKDEKAIEKCWNVFDNKGMQKGISKLEKYMNKQEWPSLLAYESLVTMEYEYYKRCKTLIRVETNRKDEKGDSLVNFLEELLVSSYKMRFIDVCRRSTIEAGSPSGDMHLRQMLVDFDPDTAVSEKGLSYYNEGEAFFRKKDFELAELNYRKALREDQHYYKANLYLGDSFWARKFYDSAMVYYAAAIALQPQLLEPRLYMIDALVQSELFYRAKKECIDAFTVYPGHNLKMKFQRILYTENKYMNEHRLLRSFYPNDIDNDNQISMQHDPFWADYRAAKEAVSKYCNEAGIIEPNGEIKDRYLEVYSIRTMLEKHENNLPKSLEFANEMRKKGYLESYVFISLFHIDIYPQFKDYMQDEANREKTKAFIEEFLISPI